MNIPYCNSSLVKVNFLAAKSDKYLRWYTQIIRKAALRASSRQEIKNLIGYSERHHVIPTCIGGLNVHENCVFLSAKEHFIAHRLLVKIFPRESKLVYALWGLANQENPYQIRNYRINSRTYELLKILRSSYISELMKGRIFSDETKAKMSASAKGNPKSPQSIEHKRKISLANMKPKEKIQCIKCGKSGDKGNLRRWHFLPNSMSC